MCVYVFSQDGPNAREVDTLDLGCNKYFHCLGGTALPSAMRFGLVCNVEHASLTPVFCRQLWRDTLNDDETSPSSAE